MKNGLGFFFFAKFCPKGQYIPHEKFLQILNQNFSSQLFLIFSAQRSRIVVVKNPRIRLQFQLPKFYNNLVNQLQCPNKIQFFTNWIQFPSIYLYSFFKKFGNKKTATKGFTNLHKNRIQRFSLNSPFLPNLTWSNHHLYPAFPLHGGPPTHFWGATHSNNWFHEEILCKCPFYTLAQSELIFIQLLCPTWSNVCSVALILFTI